jgi:hypothetical protein
MPSLPIRHRQAGTYDPDYGVSANRHSQSLIIPMVTMA